MATSGVYNILINEIIGDLKSVAIVVAIRGIGQLLGSLCYMPIIDRVSLTNVLRWLVIF